VRTFNWNAGGAALVSEIPQVAQQRIQFAFTRDKFKHLIVNHFRTPLGPNQDQPGPAGDWRGVDYAALIELKRNIGQIANNLRPWVFYLVAGLESLGDI
jgi:hypothetical protein